MLPKRKIVETQPITNFLCVQPNVRLIEAPFTVQDLVTLFEPRELHNSHIIAAGESLSGHVGQLMRVIWHGVDKRNIDNPDEETRRRMTEAVQKARTAFPSLADLSDSDVLTFVRDSIADRPLVREGEIVAGCFCDIEGTLVVDGLVVPHVLIYLQSLEADGWSVALWTDGDLDELGELLHTQGVNYPLHAKADYAGATVGRAVDDFDLAAFVARTKIRPQSFIHVSDLK